MRQHQQKKYSQFSKRIIYDRNNNKAKKQIIQVSMLQIMPYHKNNKIIKANRINFINTLQNSLKCKKDYERVTHKFINNSTLHSHHYQRDKQDKSSNAPISERQILKINNLKYRTQIQQVIKKFKNNKKEFNQKIDIRNSIKLNNQRFKLSNYCRSNLLELRNNSHFKRWESIETNFSHLDRISVKNKCIQLKLYSERNKHRSLEDIVNKIQQLKGWQDPSTRYASFNRHDFFDQLN